jgi:hypothetical protein
MMRTLFATTVAVVALAAGAASAWAQSPAEMFDSCRPHDWQRYGEAVEAGDYDALAAMLREPELAGCDVLIASATALVCADDPVGCVAPAAGPGGDVVWLHPEVFDYDPLTPYDSPLLPEGEVPYVGPLVPVDLPREFCDECFAPFEGQGPSVPPRTVSTCCDYVPLFGEEGPFPNQAPGQAYGGSRDHSSSQPTPSLPSAPSGSAPGSTSTEGSTEG